MKIKIWLFLISAIGFFTPYSVLAGEMKIYSSEGVQTITTSDPDSKDSGTWIRDSTRTRMGNGNWRTPEEERKLNSQEMERDAIQKNNSKLSDDNKSISGSKRSRQEPRDQTSPESKRTNLGATYPFNKEYSAPGEIYMDQNRGYYSPGGPGGVFKPQK